MNTCKTCKWWADSAGTFIESKELKKLVPSMDPYHPCNCPKINQDVHANPAMDGAAAENMDGHPYFVTGPDFGCIHYEPK